MQIQIRFARFVLIPGCRGRRVDHGRIGRYTNIRLAPWAFLRLSRPSWAYKMCIGNPTGLYIGDRTFKQGAIPDQYGTESYNRYKTATMDLMPVITAILGLISAQESFLGLILKIGLSYFALY